MHSCPPPLFIIVFYFTFKYKAKHSATHGPGIQKTMCCVCLVTQSCPTFATPQIVACQVPLSMGFSRQEYWSGLPFPSPGDLPDLGIEPRSPALQADFFPTELQGKLTIATINRTSFPLQDYKYNIEILILVMSQLTIMACLKIQNTRLVRCSDDQKL